MSISSHLIEVEFWILQNYSPKKLICSLPSRIRRIPCLLSNNGYYQSLTYKYGTICHFYMYFPIYQWIEHFACLLAICISSMIAFAHFVKPVSISGYLICREFVYLDIMIIAYNCSWSICCLLILFIMLLFMWKSFIYMLILLMILGKSFYEFENICICVRLTYGKEHWLET